MQNLCALKCVINIFIGTVKPCVTRRMAKIRHLWPYSISPYYNHFETMRSSKCFMQSHFMLFQKKALWYFLAVMKIHFYNKQYQTAVMGNILEASNPEAPKMNNSRMKWNSFPSVLLAFLPPLHAKWIKGWIFDIFLLHIIVSMEWGINTWGIIEVNSIQVKID